MLVIWAVRGTFFELDSSGGALSIFLGFRNDGDLGNTGFRNDGDLGSEVYLFLDLFGAWVDFRLTAMFSLCSWLVASGCCRLLVPTVTS